MIYRRHFLSGGFAIATAASAAGWSRQEADRPAKLDPKTVGLFVGKSHGDIKTVKTLLKNEPTLVNCTWDWGGGDYETGLGAASHVGRKEIANLLLDHGARLDVFAASMLGMAGVVSEMLKVRPELHATPGPHDIPMLSHAIFGREDASDVFTLLLDSGADVNAKSKMLMTPLMAAVSVSNIEQAKELLRRGADPAAKDIKGVSILDVAKRRKDKNVVELIKSAVAK